MKKRSRLILLLLSLVLLFIVGYGVNLSFDFILNQFWFTSGLLLLILLTLIDQPHFSKDANIFVNSVTAGMSLLLVPKDERVSVWVLFFVVTLYLIISSYLLIWLRKKELQNENRVIIFISRLNRQIGRPEAIFSAFFIWGGVRQFGMRSEKFDALLLFWIAFMIINMKEFAEVMNSLFEKKVKKEGTTKNILENIIEPNIIWASLSNQKIYGIGRKFNVKKGGDTIGEGVLIDERIIKGKKIGKFITTVSSAKWNVVADDAGEINLEEIESESLQDVISVVGVGTTIQNLHFEINPHLDIKEGELVKVQTANDNFVYYQVYSAKIIEENTSVGGGFQSISVEASQLGLWDETRKEFKPYDWVAPLGRIIQTAKEVDIGVTGIPSESLVVGTVPNSTFPIHVKLEDIVTHNTAIIGVTGSGKSYLSFHTIESLVQNRIRVLILDLSREHFQYLQHLHPVALRASQDVATWLNDPNASLIAVHQFANSNSFPETTASFVQASFNVLSQSNLQVGRNLPAKLCVVFEEAHSLIPEWNQAQQSDVQHVNRTARVILQGRKYGMGSIIITQRTANVTKTILNQCNTIFALQSFDQTGLDFLKNYMGEGYSHAISTLPQYHSILVGKASSSKRPIIFKVKDLQARWISPTVAQTLAVDTGNAINASTGDNVELNNGNTN